MKSLKTIVKDKGIVKRFGAWTLVLLPSGRIEAEGCWVTVSIVIYGTASYTWASDMPERLPDSVKAWLHDNYRGLENVQAQYLERIGGCYKPDIATGMPDAAYWGRFDLTK